MPLKKKKKREKGHVLTKENLQQIDIWGNTILQWLEVLLWENTA